MQSALQTHFTILYFIYPKTPSIGGGNIQKDCPAKENNRPLKHTPQSKRN
jgi:hypothetical protein